MRNNPILFVLFFATIILIIDFYTYRGLKKLIVDLKTSVKKTIKILFWIVPVVLIASFIVVPLLRNKVNPAEFLILFHFVSGTFILFYVPKLIFIFFNIIDDLIRLFSRLRNRKSEKSEVRQSQKITRGQFLTKIGIITAGIPFLSLAYGIGWGRFDLTVRKVKLSFKNLPQKFNGLKIVQLSDFHIGSLLNHIPFVEQVVERVNSLSPDLILFTGDIVNNTSAEMDKFLPILNQLNSNYGNYSILGNHDYGEYIHWDSEKEKADNLERLKHLQKEVGFDLILNASRKVIVHDEEIELVGVENWGLPPFPLFC